MIWTRDLESLIKHMDACNLYLSRYPCSCKSQADFQSFAGLSLLDKPPVKGPGGLLIMYPAHTAPELPPTLGPRQKIDCSGARPLSPSFPYPYHSIISG